MKACTSVCVRGSTRGSTRGLLATMGSIQPSNMRVRIEGVVKTDSSSIQRACVYVCTCTHACRPVDDGGAGSRHPFRISDDAT
jgi:hypothetical protein